MSISSLGSASSLYAGATIRIVDATEDPTKAGSIDKAKRGLENNGQRDVGILQTEYRPRGPSGNGSPSYSTSLITPSELFSASELAGKSPAQVEAMLQAKARELNLQGGGRSYQTYVEPLEPRSRCGEGTRC